MNRVSRQISHRGIATEPSLWQVIEERVDTDTDPNRQFVWGLRYIDDLVLRDRDTTAGGTLDERLYAMQDANWNVTAIAGTDGTVQERYAYSAYGTPTFLTASFGSSTLSYDWETLYCGYRWDATSALFHIRHRVYHPTLGTWIQRDPHAYSGAFNLYAYCTERIRSCSHASCSTSSNSDHRRCRCSDLALHNPSLHSDGSLGPRHRCALTRLSLPITEEKPPPFCLRRHRAAHANTPSQTHPRNRHRQSAR